MRKLINRTTTFTLMLSSIFIGQLYSYAGKDAIVFETNHVVDLTTLEGEIVTPFEIQNGYIKLPHVRIKDGLLKINKYKNPLWDIQLFDGSIIDFTKFNKMLLLSGGDMGGGGSN